MDTRVVISGCSCGGKSTLLKELCRRGFDVVEEPGRRIIAAERKCGGTSTPWQDPETFLRKAIEMSASDIAGHLRSSQWVFFDRGLVDAASGLAKMTGEPVIKWTDTQPRYHRKVFLAPPWPEIYVTDEDRRHPMSEAVKEYERLLRVYPSIGYEVLILPKTSVDGRAEFVLAELDQ